MKPNIADLLEAISNPNNFFHTLKDILPMRNDDGSFIFMPSSISIVFKVYYKSDIYALKCYLSDNDYMDHFKALKQFQRSYNDSFLLDFEYYKQELSVYTIDGNCSLIDVSLSKWIDGDTLGRVVVDSAYLGDKNAISNIIDKFIPFSIRLLSSGFIHGDIKPDNIIFSYEKSDFMLVDYDACYTDCHLGMVNSEIGTPWYQHPKRGSSDYGNKNPDQYSLALIILSLIAIEDDHSICERYCNGNNLIFSPMEILNGRCKAYNELLENWGISSDKYYLLKQLSKEGVEIPNILEILSKILSVRNGVSKSELVLPDRSNSLGLCRAYDKYGLIGFVDRDNRLVIDHLYNDASEFVDGIASVRIGGKSYFIDDKGHKISHSYESILAVGKRMSPVKISGKCGYIDNCTGKIIIAPQYDKAYEFCGSLARVMLLNKYFFISDKGISVFDKSFDYCTDFSDGYAVVSNKGVYNVINVNGERVIADTKRTLYAVKEGFLLISDDSAIVKMDLNKILLNKIL